MTWYIFTDGACEGVAEKDGGVGSVLVNLSGVSSMFFSERVPTGMMNVLSRDSLNPIHELELLPIL